MTNSCWCGTDDLVGYTMNKTNRNQNGTADKTACGFIRPREDMQQLVLPPVCMLDPYQNLLVPLLAEIYPETASDKFI